MSYTIFTNLPEYEHERIVTAETVVYQGNQFVALAFDVQVIVEQRGNTNYDNQRRCVHPRTGQHLFYIKGKFGIPTNEH